MRSGVDAKAGEGFPRLSRRFIGGTCEEQRAGIATPWTILGAAPSLAKLPQTTHLSPMSEITERLCTALADRYRIERHLGEGSKPDRGPRVGPPAASPRME